MSDSEPRVTVLLNAYGAERLDDAPAIGNFLALLAATLGLLTIIGFALVHASSLPAWVIALAPVPPIPFIAFGALISHVSQIRGQGIDMYEGELRDLMGDKGPDHPQVPYGHTLLNRVVWQRAYARVAIGLASLALFALYVGVLIQSFRYAHHQEFEIALASLVGCGLATTILVGMFGIVLFPQTAIKRGLAEMPRPTGNPGPAMGKPANIHEGEPKSST